MKTRHARLAMGLFLASGCAILAVSPAPALAASFQGALGFWPAFGDSPQARSTQTLFWVVIGLCFVILAIVETLLLVIMVRFRRRTAQEPRQVYQNRRLEFWWTVVPGAMLLAVFIYMVPVTNSLASVPDNAIPVTVTGHQWWWQVQYPAEGVSTANEIHVPAGRPIRFTLLSADVVHNFWIPNLGGKEQLIPGVTNTWTFTPDKVGRYDGECSEYCGAGHAWMRLTLVSDSPSDFQSWVAREQQPAALPRDDQSRAAETLFVQNACGQCHTIRGLAGASGTVGPELTHIASNATLGAGRLQNTEANMTAWIENAQALKPGSYMPNLHLSRAQSESLARWLESLK